MRNIKIIIFFIAITLFVIYSPENIVLAQNKASYQIAQNESIPANYIAQADSTQMHEAASRPRGNRRGDNNINGLIKLLLASIQQLISMIQGQGGGLLSNNGNLAINNTPAPLPQNQNPTPAVGVTAPATSTPFQTQGGTNPAQITPSQPTLSPCPNPMVGIPSPVALGGAQGPCASGQITQPVAAVTSPPVSVAPSTAPNTTGAVAGCAQADIQTLVNNVSQANVTALLKALVQDDTKPVPNELITRYVKTTGNVTKTNWIKQTMDSYGYQSVLLPDAEGNSVVATLKGTDANSIFNVSSHFDSYSNDKQNTAPGADDNGSGTVVVMEVARVLKGLPASCLKYSIDFSPFNAEETGLNGSAAYVKSLSGKTMKGNFNMDMVGTSGSGFHANSKSSSDQPLRDKINEVNTKYNIGAQLTTGTGGQGVDSESFWGANMPSVLFEENTFSSVYHTTNDKTDKVDFAQITAVAKLLVAALAELENQ